MASTVATGVLAGAPMRAVIRVIAGDDQAIYRRTLGHVNDVEVELVEVQAPELEPKLADQLATADALASSQGARVVVWFELDAPRPGSIVIYVSEVGSQRLLAQRVGEGEKVLTSATIEAAALVVRTALRALAAGGVIGVARATLVVDATPAPPGRKAARMVRPPPRPIGRAPRYGAEIGWQVEADGSDAPQAIVVGGVWLPSPWEVRLGVAVGVPTTAEDRYGVLKLSRHAAIATVGWHALETSSWQATASVRAGAMLFRRSTEEVTGPVRAAPASTSVSALLGPELSLRWCPGSSFVGLVIGAGADWIPGRPNVGYEVNGHFQSVHGLWALEPRAFAAVELLAR